MNRFFAHSQLTPAAARIVDRCRMLANDFDSSDTWAGHLILTLLLDESLASASLQKSGVDVAWLIAGGLGGDVASSAKVVRLQENSGIPTAVESGLNEQLGLKTISSIDLRGAPDEFTRILERAVALCRRSSSDEGVSSWHLLVAVIEINQFVCEQFRIVGAVPDVMQQDAELESETRLPVLPADIVLQLDQQPGIRASEDDMSRDAFHDLSDAQSNNRISQSSGFIWRIVDANLNRAREGLRVLEDYARFMRNDADLSLNLKQLRHSLAEAERQLMEGTAVYGDAGIRISLASRNTPEDVGTALTTTTERTRDSVNDLVVANCRRVQEAFRSLEEFGKLLNPKFADVMKQSRYQTYELEQRLLQSNVQSLRQRRIARLKQSCLYALITESSLRMPWQLFVEQLLHGGVDILQLREKNLPDRELIQRARWLVTACRNAGALCIINDRPDIAVLSEADGVHVGQDEMSARDARRIVGDEVLLGISTHQMLQVQDAVADGADYLGVGPVFPGSTKSFELFPGLQFVTQVASAERSTPWFAIGGINSSNLSNVIAAGADRIAVTAALSMTEYPGDSAKELRSILKPVEVL